MFGLVKKLSHCRCHELTPGVGHQPGWFERLLLRFVGHFDIVKTIPDFDAPPCNYCNGTGHMRGLYGEGPDGKFIEITVCPRCKNGIPLVTVVYLRRFYLFRSKWFGSWLSKRVGDLYLHHIVRSDDDPDPHDHPWAFTGLILAGGYTDEQWVWMPEFPGITSIDLRTSQTETVRPTRAAFRAGPFLEEVEPLTLVQRDATHIHRVIVPEGKTAWTLIFTSPYGRDWNFITKDGPVYWRTYLNIPANVDVGE